MLGVGVKLDLKAVEEVPERGGETFSGQPMPGVVLELKGVSRASEFDSELFNGSP